MRFLLALIVFVCLAFQSAYAQEFFYYQPNGNFSSATPQTDLANIHAKVCKLVGSQPATLSVFTSAVSAGNDNSKYEWALYGWINDPSTTSYKLVRPIAQAVEIYSSSVANAGFICFGTKPILGYQGVLKRNAGYWTPNGAILKEVYTVAPPAGYTDINVLATDCFNGGTGAIVAMVNPIRENFYQNSSICVNSLYFDNLGQEARVGYYFGVRNIAGCAFGFHDNPYTSGVIAAGLCYGPKPVRPSYTYNSRTINIGSFNSMISKYSRFENIPNAYLVKSLP
ncbi:hypothetical protein DFA_08145 [Cavenderia fasciculata]|uniref:Uncharacterized protein n=1 Tax=Cavenderia fasciculata TaxID=261658 RepID=F4Q5A2_CACFS|nr:uncharacterized protein DFA_08145 [Cavenderia fasciculata]EGG17161.1 hypothetical protein DFA_08145 [Cavenderia fasciculata]|eukprot:XP_004355645.1 hypothetical protein DFA_08145 [Cavenderia fasciculata]